MDFKKIGENYSDFTSRKLITIFIKIFALINSWHLQSKELKSILPQNGKKDLNFQVLSLIRKHYSLPLSFHLCLCEWPKIYVSIKLALYFTMALTNVFQSFNLFLVFVFTLFPAVIVNVAPFSAYKTHTTHNSLHYVKFACTIFYRKKLACSPLIVLIYTSCESI